MSKEIPDLEIRPAERVDRGLPAEIILDESLRNRFEVKLVEYERRVNTRQFQAPEVTPIAIKLDAEYKAALVRVLLATGRLDISAIEAFAKAMAKDSFDEEVFDNALRVIVAYNSGEASTVKRGTGF